MNFTTMRLAGVSILLIFAASVAGAFEEVTAKNFAKGEFEFPADIRGAESHLLFLGIATDQDNGTWQGKELIRWHKALLAAGVDPDVTRFWHFPVIENPPFFVKGLIRRGIAKDYVDLLPPEQGAVLFVDDAQAFAAAAGLELNGQPTVMIYRPGQGVLAVQRGEVRAEAIAELADLLENSASRESAPAGT